MADSSSIAPASAAPFEASDLSGTVYVIDLVGFSALTEHYIASDARIGTEQVSRMVTELFGQLMSALAERDIRFGGFAGDALIAWQTRESASLEAGELQSLAARICLQTSPDVSCRTAQAEGRFWVAAFELGDHRHPLVWGPAVRQAFTSLARNTSDTAEPSETLSVSSGPPATALATASVAARWTIVIRALSSTACQEARPEHLLHLLERAHEICAAYSAEIDNFVQDDKGLLIIIVLPPTQPSQHAERDALLKTLTIGRTPLVQPEDAASGYGTVFRYRPELGDQSVVITVGPAVNRAAKQIATEAPDKDAAVPAIPISAPAPVTALIGRDIERQRLHDAHQAALSQRHIAALIGPAGIGKTSLLKSLCAETGTDSVIAEVTPGSRYLPFGSAQDLAEACDLPARIVFDASGQAELAARLPPLVIVENWQWCDDDSKRLIRRLHSERASGLLLVSSRTEIDDFAADTRLNVEALNEDQSNELIEQLAPGQLSDALKRSVFDLTSGTPFWLVQAALHYADPSQASDAGANMTGLESLLSARARDLSAPALALWRLYCAWRWPLPFDRAEALLSHFNIRATQTHLDELQNLGWLLAEETGNRPAHDILADWGMADLPVTFELALHAAIARSLTIGKASPARIARHWQSAGKDLRAAIWYDRAARRADRAGAHRLTVAHLDQAEALAAEAARQRSIRRLDRLALAATANWGVGKLRRAKQSLTQFDAVAKTIANGPDKRAALQRAATIQSEIGQFAGNSNMMLTGIYRGWRNGGVGEDAYEIKARRQGFVYYALALLRLPVHGRFKTLIHRAHELGEYRSEALLGCAAATLKSKACEWDEAERILTDCLKAIALTDDRQMLGVVQCLLGLNDLFQGHSGKAYDWFEQVASIGREQDHHLFIVWGAYAKAEALFYQGKSNQAEALALEARHLAKGLGDHQSVCIIEGLLAQIFVAKHQNALAFKHARNALRFAAKMPPSNFSSLEGIAAPAQVGATLKQRGHRPQDIDSMIRIGRKALNSYAQVFELAQPRQHYVEGCIALTQSDRKTAQKQFHKAKAKAVAFGMSHERRLAETALTEMEESPHGATA